MVTYFPGTSFSRNDFVKREKKKITCNAHRAFSIIEQYFSQLMKPQLSPGTQIC